VIVSRNIHTESSQVNLFSCKGEDREQFEHYLDNFVRHHRSVRNRGINPESSEDVLDAFKDIDQGVVTCPLMHGRLAILNVTRSGAEIMREIRTDRRIRIPEKTTLVGRDTLGIESSGPSNVPGLARMALAIRVMIIDILFSILTMGPSHLRNLVSPFLNLSNACACSWDMSRIESGLSQLSILEASGWSQRPIPVCSAYSVKAAFKSVSKLEEVKVVSGIRDMG
jgi:hypothetical protein